MWRVYQQCPERVRRWLEEEYPAIKAKAQREKARVFFADEAGVRSDHHSRHDPGERRGRRGRSAPPGARFGLNLISAVSPQGEFRFMTIKGRTTARMFIEFLKHLDHNADRPVFPIVEGHSAHKAKMVERYVESLEGRLRLFFPPPYSPELNRYECAWNDFKNNAVGRKVTGDPDTLKREVLRFLRYLHATPERVRAYVTNGH